MKRKHPIKYKYHDNYYYNCLITKTPLFTHVYILYCTFVHIYIHICILYWISIFCIYFTFLPLYNKITFSFSIFFVLHIFRFTSLSLYWNIFILSYSKMEPRPIISWKKWSIQMILNDGRARDKIGFENHYKKHYIKTSPFHTRLQGTHYVIECPYK